MSRIKEYLKKVLSYMEAQGIRKKISLPYILFDVVVSYLRYGATISDYFYFRFYEKKHYSRKTFMTAKDKAAFYKVMNDESERALVQDKDIFNEKFKEYLKRESIAVPETSKQAFCEFIQDHATVFIKPVKTGGGSGIMKVETGSVDNAEELYDSICSKGTHVVEAGIVQHHKMAELHPQSTNSVRISSVLDGDEVKILFAVLRCGVGDSYVDNHNNGGLTMLVDIESGKVSSLASGRKSLNVLKHPDTGIFFPGFQIPHWDKCIELVDAAARKIPSVRYVGWDVAILEDGVCMIEANPGGDFNVWQEPTQVGRKEEMEQFRKRFE